MPRRIGASFVWVISCFVIAVVGAELFLRATAHVELDWVRNAYQVREGYVSFRPGARLGFPNERGENIPLEIDSRGFRNPPDAFGQARILLLGDSFAAAVNTPQQQTIAGRLGQAGYRVYNAGADGSGTFHQLAILEHALNERTFDDVVVLFFTGNDFHDNFMTVDGVVQQTARRSASTVASEDGSAAGAKSVLAVGAGGGGSDYGSIGARPKWRQQIMNACDALLLCQQIYNNFWLGQVRGYARDPWTNRRYMQMLTMTSAQRPQIDKAVANTRIALAAMKGLAESKGSRLTIVAVPSRSETLQSWYDMMVSSGIARADLLGLLRTEKVDFDRPERMIRTLCSELQINYHALLGDMRKAEIPSELYGVVDGHWVAEGQAVGSRSLDAYFKSKNIGGVGSKR